MYIIYVPRTCGSTLILTVGQPSPVPVMTVLVTFRDGVVQVGER